ncbi:unnamed protein product [Rhizophagus irregularis]|nr:unnamed protein product [Rhizophagus irregularis]
MPELLKKKKFLFYTPPKFRSPLIFLYFKSQKRSFKLLLLSFSFVNIIIWKKAAFQITQYVRRPGTGREGRVVRVRTNFFEVITMPETNISHYDRKNQRELRNTRPVFDGQSNMFAFRKLQSDASTFDVELAEENVPVELFQFLNARGSMTENCNMAIMAMDILISHKIAAIYPTVRRSFYTNQGARPLSGV